MSNPENFNQNKVDGKDEWLTPPEIIQALGEFDLDPCAPMERPWDTAKNHMTITDDGLSQEWKGRVWCNPPYGRECKKWIERLADHNNGIGLTFARTDTIMWHEHIWSRASGILFLRGRLTFYHGDGGKAASNGGAPSALIAYGEHNAEVLRLCSLEGWFVNLCS